MMPPVPPGIREIDPDAEAARLAEARKDPPGRVWGIDHPDGQVTVRIDGCPFPSRAAADAERRKCDEDCDSCDGGRHTLVWRGAPIWVSE